MNPARARSPRQANHAPTAKATATAFALAILVPLVAPGRAVAGYGYDDAPDFRRDVAPILVRSCLGCHNARRAEARFDMTSLETLRRGGERVGEETLVPGDAEGSHLVEVIGADASPRMPYKLPPLPDAEIALIAAWVGAGAPLADPEDATAPLVSLVDPASILPAATPSAKPAGPILPPVAALAFAGETPILAAATDRNVEIRALRAVRGSATEPDNFPVLMRLAPLPGRVSALRFSPDLRVLHVIGGEPGLFGFVANHALPAPADRLADRPIPSEADVPILPPDRVIRDHDDAILDADLSPDGSTLATASYDRSIRIRDARDLGAAPRATLREHTDAVYGVRFSPDGALLATASGDRSLKIWSVAEGRRLLTLSESTAELYAAAFTPDGRGVLGAGVDRAVRLWRLAPDLRSATLERTMFAHEAAVTRLLPAPDGTALLTAGEDRALRLWTLPDLAPRAALADLPDWPRALAVPRGPIANGNAKANVPAPFPALVALGRADGHLDLVENLAGNRAASIPLIPRPPVPPLQAEAPKPQLFRAATLNPPSPRGAARGSTVRLNLTGVALASAREVAWSDPRVVTRMLPPDPAKPDALSIEVDFPVELDVAVLRLHAVTPAGLTNAQPFDLFAEDAPESAEDKLPATDSGMETSEGDFPTARVAVIPSVVAGTLGAPGEKDVYALSLDRARALRVRIRAADLGSPLRARLVLLDSGGKIVARASHAERNRDPELVYPVVDESGGGGGSLDEPGGGEGPVALRLVVADAEDAGSGGHFYRLHLETPPLSGEPPLLAVDADNPEPVTLPVRNSGEPTRTFRAQGPLEPGSIVSIAAAAEAGNPGSHPRAADPRRVVAVRGPRLAETEPNDDPLGPLARLEAPAFVTGRIDAPGDVDHYRIAARGGRTLVIETHARRLGHPTDTRIEVLDDGGRPTPLAVLRPVAETRVAFRDHGSLQPNIRLTQWSDLAMGDHLLVGRDLMRLLQLPRNPDDDAIFHNVGGRRLAHLGTTPEQHYQDQIIHKVEIHPPGARFPAGGPPPVTLFHRNDDGPPPFDKDSRVMFTAPADGEYLVRVEDALGAGGPRHRYLLSIREPAPSFQVAITPDNPALPPGGRVLLDVALTPIDDFADGVEVDLDPDSLPPGYATVPAIIEPGLHAGSLALAAGPDSPPIAAESLRYVARSRPSSPDRAPVEVRGTVGGAGARRGRPVIMAREPDLKVAASPETIRLEPGGRAPVLIRVERGAAFNGRVPVNLKNLPYGVRVLDIGLNGILVTETETERTAILYAEPWVAPQTRIVHPAATVEATRFEAVGPPARLVIEPPSPAADE